MQRGAKFALASTIVLGGLIGAALFRKPPQPAIAPRTPPADAPKWSTSPLPVDEPAAAQLSGQIDPAEATATDTAAKPSLTAEPLTTNDTRRETMPSSWQQAVTSAVPASPFEQRVAAGANAAAQFHRIRDGDTLSSLARQYLGSSKRFMEIYEANLDRLSNPDLLPIGAELKIPPADAVREAPEPVDDAIVAPMTQIPPGTFRRIETSSAPSAPRTYRVKAGDTLVSIAKHFYGDGERYLEIYQANRERLKQPADLREGLVLTIP